MSRKLLTFGYDACHRWAVLRFAGFTVHECGSIRELRQMLMTSTNVAAVIMVEDIVSVPQEAIIAARSYSDGPVILFEGRYPNESPTAFHLRVRNLTAPAEWLQGIQDVIQNHHACAKAERSDRDLGNSDEVFLV